MIIKFNSVLGKPHGYAWLDGSDETWGRAKASHPLSPYAYVYDTLGDGNTQHTREYQASAPFFEDYCLSFAQYIIDNVTDENLQKAHLYITRPGSAEVAFLAKIKHNPEKRQWFTLKDKGGFKITSREDKKHDTRYHEVYDWANGSKEGVVRLWITSLGFEPGLFARAAAWDSGACYIGDFEETCPGLGSESLSAFRALDKAIQAKDGLYSVKRQIECCQHNIGNRKETAKAQPAAA